MRAVSCAHRPQAEKLLIRLQIVKSNLALFRRILAAYPNHFEPGFLRSMLDADDLAHLDAIYADQPHSQARCIYSLGTLDKWFPMPVESPHLDLKIDFHPWLSASAHPHLDFLGV